MVSYDDSNGVKQQQAPWLLCATLLRSHSFSKADLVLSMQVAKSVGKSNPAAFIAGNSTHHFFKLLQFGVYNERLIFGVVLSLRPCIDSLFLPARGLFRELLFLFKKRLVIHAKAQEHSLYRYVLDDLHLVVARLLFFGILELVVHEPRHVHGARTNLQTDNALPCRDGRPQSYRYNGLQAYNASAAQNLN